MQNSAISLLRRNVPIRGARRVLVLLVAVVAVVVGLLTLHAPGAAAHGHGRGVDSAASGAHSGAAPHDHGAAPLSTAASTPDHSHAASDPGHGHVASGSDHGAVRSSPGAASSAAPDAVLAMASGGSGSAECPQAGGTHCCAATIACVPVLALLSASQALGGAPVVLAGVALCAVAAFSLRLAPVRPPSLAQLSTFRI
ncbi:hypothetical protein ACFDTO_29185 [Microbacteriaceae bacterium 4G12]